MTDVHQEDGALSDQMRRGLRWSFVNTLGVRVMSFASGIILARLLVPEDFGAFAAALAVVNILFGWNDLGMLLALVRWRGDLKAAARTAMTLSMLPSIGIYVVCFALAPAFAEFMDSPRSVGILRLIALTVVIDGFVAVPQGLLVRNFSQKRMAIIEFTAVPINVITTVVLAVLGFGPWALAIGQVAGNCVSAALLTIMAPFRVRPGFDRAIARSMLSFGIPLAFTSMVEYILLNADYVVVGSFLGPAALGFYLLAFNVSNWPVNLLSDAIRRVSIAGFAELSKDEKSLRKNFNPMFALLLTATLPAILLLVLLAPEVVRFLYGSKWGPSGEVLSFLAILAGSRIAVGFIFDLLVGAGRSRTTLWLQSIWLVVLVPSLALGAHLGNIKGVAIAHAIVAVAVASPLFLVAMSRFGIELRDLLRRLVRPAIGGAVAASVGLALSTGLHHTLSRLLVMGPAIALAYVVCVVPLHLLTPSSLLGAVRSRRTLEPPPSPTPAAATAAAGAEA